MHKTNMCQEFQILFQDESAARIAIKGGLIEEYLDKLLDESFDLPLDLLATAYQDIVPLLEARIMQRLTSLLAGELAPEFVAVFMSRYRECLCKELFESEFEDTRFIARFMLRYANLVSYLQGDRHGS